MSRAQQPLPQMGYFRRPDSPCQAVLLELSDQWGSPGVVNAESFLLGLAWGDRDVSWEVKRLLCT